MRDSVLIEHLRHFFRNHVTIVGDRHEWDFFPYPGHALGSGTFGALGGALWCVTHSESIHYSNSQKVSYSNASREDC
jgi:hypothetical protein